MNKFIILTTAMLTSLAAMSVEARTSKFETDLSGAEEVIDTTVSGTVIPVIGLVTGAYGEAVISVSKDRSTINYRLKVNYTANPQPYFHGSYPPWPQGTQWTCDAVVVWRPQ